MLTNNMFHEGKCVGNALGEGLDQLEMPGESAGPSVRVKEKSNAAVGEKAKAPAGSGAEAMIIGGYGGVGGRI